VKTHKCSSPHSMSRKRSEADLPRRVLVDVEEPRHRFAWLPLTAAPAEGIHYPFLGWHFPIAIGVAPMATR
jgi:hypothetical protein